MFLETKPTITILKRDGKEVPYQPEKIALAIRKGFDSVQDPHTTATDSHQVYLEVIQEIEKNAQENLSIPIESIQDIIEKKLEEFNYHEVYESFKSYRTRRRESRNVFASKQHKFLKAIEKLSLKDSSEDDTKRENANVNGDGAMGLMLQYGSTVAKEFSKAYLMHPKHTEAHDRGQIHIHDLDFLPMGTTTCSQIDLSKLFKNGFSTGHGHLRTPKDIMSYGALAAIVIQSNQNDQHGGQSIPAFDYYMAPGVLNTFKKQLKQIFADYSTLSEFTEELEELIQQVDELKSMDTTGKEFNKYFSENHPNLGEKAIQIALAKTNRITYQAMEAFIHNLNTMHSRAGAQVPFSSINFGTDTSVEGRMVTKNYLLASESGLGKGETPIFPISIFKVKEGVNYFKEDPNYDLFELSCKVSAKRLFPNFSFIDSPFNLQYYKPGVIGSEITYMGCRTRVIGDVTDPEHEEVLGRGNLSFTSINLVRLGIKHGLPSHEQENWDAFYKELDELLELVKDQLLDRLEIQGAKKVYNFPFLMGQGVWKNSDTLNPEDALKNILKTGTLTIGFIGLAETLQAMMGVHHAQDSNAQAKGLEIIRHLRAKCDEFAKQTGLNFSLIATPAEGLSGRFVQIDKSIFGEIKDITDKPYYTNSFHVPVHYPISIDEKIAIEAPYHALTNAGHITYVELDGDATKNQEAFMQVIRKMKESHIGYGAINHPVDRDPVCGYTGIIEDVCPNCGRDVSEHGAVSIERIRRITGYLVGTVDRFNSAKQHEEKNRVKHQF